MILKKITSYGKIIKTNLEDDYFKGRGVMSISMYFGVKFKNQKGI